MPSRIARYALSTLFFILATALYCPAQTPPPATPT